MKITHLSNSFIKVSTPGLTLVCDPWVGFGNHGGWHSFPEYPLDSLVRFVADADLVYISHMHSDHFDPAFLAASGLLGKRFVIKRFDNGVLARRLKGMGVAEVLELDAFQVHTEGAVSLAIVPQMTSNSAGLDDEVNYDLDTSLVLHDGQHTFFNQVDNPLSLADLAQVKAFISERFGAIDIACLMAGAAGEYPQCFIGIDRAGEQARLVADSVAKLREQVRLLAPRCLFPAGGTYFIPGKFHVLNDHIAQPSHEQYAEAVAALTTPMVLEGGLQVDVAAACAATTPAQVAAAVQRAVVPLGRDREQAIAAHAGDLYPYQAEPLAEPAEGLPAVLARAEANYRAELQRRQVQLDCDVVFRIHDDLRCDGELQLLSQPAATHALRADLQREAERRLEIHVDRQALLRCLTRKGNWNQTLSGSLCLFDRRPNVYNPTTLFSLNFFVA
ncbi:MAG: MBL fold metallo-hydrolase [Burkholderiales bacterium]|nr:MBL fold metallo-hydrolase [Burkholderiales bacterium]